MVKTYREVLQDIRPGEIWECIESDSIIRAIRYYEDEAIDCIRSWRKNGGWLKDIPMYCICCTKNKIS